MNTSSRCNNLRVYFLGVEDGGLAREDGPVLDGDSCGLVVLDESMCHFGVWK